MDWLAIAAACAAGSLGVLIAHRMIQDRAEVAADGRRGSQATGVAGLPSSDAPAVGIAAGDPPGGPAPSAGARVRGRSLALSLSAAVFLGVAWVAAVRGGALAALMLVLYWSALSLLLLVLRDRLIPRFLAPDRHRDRRALLVLAIFIGSLTALALVAGAVSGNL